MNQTQNGNHFEPLTNCELPSQPHNSDWKYVQKMGRQQARQLMKQGIQILLVDHGPYQIVRLSHCWTNPNII